MRQKNYDSIHQKLRSINRKNTEVFKATQLENNALTEEVISLKEKRKDDSLKIWLISILFFLSSGWFFYHFVTQKKYKRRFQKLVEETKSSKNTKRISADNQSRIPSINKETLDHLLAQLKKFEEEQQYLDPNITAPTLAKRFKSNSSYLSVVVNTYKQKNISQYVNDLRIDYVIQKLQSDTKFRKYTIKAISKEIGFSSSESFSKKFYNKTGIYPSYFIKKLEENE